MTLIVVLLKLSAATVLNILLTVFLWKFTRGKKHTLFYRLSIGVIFGLMAVAATHFGVDYSHMMLNVRDMAPLSAGLFFDPVSGIIAGLIGGIERYIAGTYWGIGSYTRIACSISTCLSGFVSAALYVFIFKRRKPSAVVAFFTGAVMEVLHMYIVLITHRSDMEMAFYVVRAVSVPMIEFTAVGLSISSAIIQMLMGQWENPLRRISKSNVTVSRRFQNWLFRVTLIVLLLNFLFSFMVQTQTAVQEARNTLDTVSSDIRQTFLKLRQTSENIETLAIETAEKDALGIARTLDKAGDITDADDAFLQQLMHIYGVEALTAVGSDHRPVASAGDSPIYSALLTEVIDGQSESLAIAVSSSRVVAGARCDGGMIQVVVSTDGIAEQLKLSELNDSLSYFHVGQDGTFDIFRPSGLVTYGNHKNSVLNSTEQELTQKLLQGKTRTGSWFGVDSICRAEVLADDATLVVCLPISEVYANRDIQAYESAFADILLFAVLYMLISILVEHLVVNNLKLVNESLHKITGGDLDEIVNVRSASEFASLSNDINRTVTALKGYIRDAEKRIEQELELARAIQESALPRNFRFPRNDFELYATMDPAREVGGDFYDFFFVGPDRLALVIADVSGKGIPAALFMMRGKTAIRSVAESGGSPGEILSRTNNALCEGNDAEMFITAWIGIIDLTTGHMVCANAGHEYPVLMRSGSDYEVFHDQHGLVLAAMENIRFKEYELQLEPGDRLFVYTDGIPEAIDEHTQQYGIDRLVSKLNRLKDAPMEQVLPAVREDISAFVGKADQFDDITMLGLCYYGKNGADEKSE